MSWSSDDNSIEFVNECWRLKLNPENAGHGVELSNSALDESLAVLGILDSQKLKLNEHVLRGSESIVEYRTLSDPDVRLNVCYDVKSASSERIVIELTAAINTRDFSSFPTVEFDVPCRGESLESINPYRAGRFTGALIVEQRDVTQGRLIDGGGKLEFFGDFLERGVIRKCRLRLIVASDDKAVGAEQELESLSAAPLPLLA